MYTWGRGSNTAPIANDWLEAADRKRILNAMYIETLVLPLLQVQVVNAAAHVCACPDKMHQGCASSSWSLHNDQSLCAYRDSKE